MNKFLRGTKSRAPASIIRHVRSTADALAFPVIDIGPMYSHDSAAKSEVARHVGAAATDFGFLYVENHAVPEKLIGQVYEFARIFFALDLNVKMDYYIGHSRNHRGYVPVTERGDYADEGGQRAYEAFDMSLDTPAANIETDADRSPLGGPNVWPEIDGFRECLSRYYDEMRRLGGRLCEAFEMALGIPRGFFERHMQRPTSQLRLIHYLPVPGSRRDIRMGAHTDYECFTILHSRQPGLQILDRERRWHDAPVVEGAFAINIGDLFEAWTNRRFVATAHRVLTDGTERMSIPFFMSTDYGTIVSPLPGVNERDAVPANAPFVAGDHLMGQLLRDFPYLKKRYQNGEISLPEGMPACNPFETRISEARSNAEQKPANQE